MLSSQAANYYIPEYEDLSQYYFAYKAKYLSTTPVPVPDFCLWAQIDSLDTITSPFTVIATKSKGETSYMYPIVFSDDTQKKNIEIFEITQESGRNIFFIPHDRFLQLEAARKCVQVAGNNWLNCSFRYHVLAALFRMNVIPSLSLSLFAREDLFEVITSKFTSIYSVNGTLPSVLATLFSDILFALDFFGFTKPNNFSEKISLEAALSLSEQFTSLPNHQINEEKRYFAFGEIKYAISNYHSSCYQDRDKPDDIFDYESYSNLMSSLDFVKKTLTSLNLFPDDKPVREALKSGILAFQLQNKLPTGICDLFTLRHLWNKSLDSSCDLIGLCRLSGILTKDLKLPNYKRALPKIKSPVEYPKLEPVNAVVNKIFEQVRDKSEASEWIMKQAENSVQSHIERIDNAVAAAKDIEGMITEIEKRLASTVNQNDDSAAKFEETSKLFDKILEEHIVMKQEFAAIQKRINEEKKGNQILLVLVICLSLFIIYKWFH